MRWFILILVFLIIVNSAQPWLRRFGLGRLPGDLRFRLFGREWFLPVASSVVLSLLIMTIHSFL